MQPRVLSRFGFLYNGYSLDRNMYWWESVVMLRKLSIVLVGVLVSDPFDQVREQSSVIVLIVSVLVLFDHKYDGVFTLHFSTDTCILFLPFASVSTVHHLS
jgi:hypothetical protein